MFDILPLLLAAESLKPLTSRYLETNKKNNE